MENGSCLRTRAGEGARGPSKGGSRRPKLEFQTDPPPLIALRSIDYPLDRRSKLLGMFIFKREAVTLLRIRQLVRS